MQTKPRALFTPELIKEIRATLGLTLEQAAARAGVTLFTWHRWESGKRHPRWQHQQTLEEMYESAKRKRPKKPQTEGE